MHSRALIPVMTSFLEGILDLGDGRNEAEHFATYGLKETAKNITSGFGYAITTGLKRGLPKPSRPQHLRAGSMSMTGAMASGRPRVGNTPGSSTGLLRSVHG